MLPTAQSILSPRPDTKADYSCALTYEERFLRRRKLTTDCGISFVVDLPKTTDLKHGDRLTLSDDKTVEIRARSEKLIAVSADNLLSLAWHIGNRHTPCQIEADRLLICHDHVIEHMIKRLGGNTRVVTEPFTPEGGAYGMGRTHSHDYGNNTLMSMSMSTSKTFLTALQWLSPAFPIGSFAYSHGLEWAIDAGHVTDQVSLQRWLEDLLDFGSARNDAILVSLAFQAKDAHAIKTLNQLAVALAPSSERRSETTLQGQAFRRTVRDVWGHEMPNLCYPVALGHGAKLEELDQEEIIAAYLHAFIANLISAAVRLVPLGQTQGQQILLALAPDIAKRAAEALISQEDDLRSISFLSDVASMRHETLHTRVFKT